MKASEVKKVKKNKQKEWVSVPHLVESILGVGFYDNYYGEIQEYTKRGTCIVKIYYDRKRITLIKPKRGFWDKLNKKYDIYGAGLYLKFKEPFVHEYISTELVRSDRIEFKEDIKSFTDTLKQKILEGWIPKKDNIKGLVYGATGLKDALGEKRK